MNPFPTAIPYGAIHTIIDHVRGVAPADRPTLVRAVLDVLAYAAGQVLSDPQVSFAAPPGGFDLPDELDRIVSHHARSPETAGAAKFPWKEVGKKLLDLLVKLLLTD